MYAPQCHGRSLPPGQVYHRVLLRMRDLVIYLSRCVEFTGLSVKPEYGSPTTRNATKCLGQLRKKHMPSLYYAYFFVLTTRSCSLQFFSSVFYMTIVAGIGVFKFKHRDAILKDNE